MSRPSPDPRSFAEAVSWFRAKVPMTDSDFEILDGDAHARALMVAGVEQLDLVTQVWEELDNALAQGTTLADFADAVEARLTDAWGHAQPWRIETIYRTNVQAAYSRGRWEQQSTPEVKKLRPFWEYAAVLDSRTSTICRPLDGTILPADDAWWSSHNPPCHFSCRSTVITLTEAQAKERGGAGDAPRARAAEGFGLAPDASDWTPDLKGYPPELVTAYRAKT